MQEDDWEKYKDMTAEEILAAQTPTIEDEPEESAAEESPKADSAQSDKKSAKKD